MSTCGDCKYLIQEDGEWFCDNEESFFDGIGFDPRQSVAQLQCSVFCHKDKENEVEVEYKSPNQGHFEF
ncbi:MAG: hypothetical protein LBI78_07530 [Campylobacteraceae bacterium]|jgi:hypothetical protein|nr:hypothetical protein [Campylobacteraceae bacterium]